MPREEERTRAVRSIALALHVRGPMSRAWALTLLHALGLAKEDAELALAEACESGTLVEEEGKVRPGRAR